jgi:hypothetical protein
MILIFFGRPVALGQFLGEQRRHPEAAQQLAHRRALAALVRNSLSALAQHQSPNPYCLPT